MFSVSSFYQAQLGAGDISFPWRGVWVSRVPSKVAFFVWLAVHGRILTLDNLMRRGHVLVNWCCLCCHDVEPMSNLLLLHCPVTFQLWGLFFGVFNLVWVQQGTVKEVLASWRGSRVGKRC